jgi:phosphoadenosine phosphosulfate reductase
LSGAERSGQVTGATRARRRGAAEGPAGTRPTDASHAELAVELAAADAELATAPPSAVIAWALGRFARRLVLAASFQDAVLVDLAVAVDPAVPVVFLDTGAHFPETYEYVELLRRRYGLDLTVTEPGPEAAAWPCGSERCCELRKVEPLRAVLDGREAWMTGVKRVDSPSRAAAPVVGVDPVFGVAKVNPLATWTDEDVAGYERDHGLPCHPLAERGYVSIGCAPTTRPVDPGDDPRAGRWPGSTKTECGLHR